MERPFDRPVFTHVMSTQFFSSNRNGIPPTATGGEDAFKSSDRLRQHEKEMPRNIVALACTAVSTYRRRRSQTV